MVSLVDNAFLERLRQHPHFDFKPELDRLLERHGCGPQLVQAIVDERLLPKDEACRFWADSLNVAYVNPFACLITDEAVAKVPVEVARKLTAIPLYMMGGALTVAMADPTDGDGVRRLALIAQTTISAVFALPKEIEDAILIHYSTEEAIEETLRKMEQSPLFKQLQEGADTLELVNDDAIIVAVLEDIVRFALRERATDIHIEPQDGFSRVRLRIDGNLREILRLPRKLNRPLVARIKVLSSMNIAETRFPQDGRFSMPIGSGLAHFRVSTIPTLFGEKAVVRIVPLSGQRTMITLDKIMMSQTVVQPFKRAIQNPHGIVFVTGPTGSGKTTTIYAAVHELNSPNINISTIEDPIEIQLPGVTQSQVNSNIDLKFSSMLRALMRQDPDAILVGEIRDAETAKIATEAALTGHIVFATLHTNTAPQAIVRLMELGVPPYMVAPSILAVLAQQLVARICDCCKEPYVPSRELLQKYYNDDVLPPVTFHRGRGCPACRYTGYKGRIAVHELVLVSEEIRMLIGEGRSAQAIASAAAKIGYRPLRYDALKKVLLGLTTIEEIDRNTCIEWAT